MRLYLTQVCRSVRRTRARVRSKRQKGLVPISRDLKHLEIHGSEAHPDFVGIRCSPKGREGKSGRDWVSCVTNLSYLSIFGPTARKPKLQVHSPASSLSRVF